MRISGKTGGNEEKYLSENELTSGEIAQNYWAESHGMADYDRLYLESCMLKKRHWIKLKRKYRNFHLILI